MAARVPTLGANITARSFPAFPHICAVPRASLKGQPCNRLCFRRNTCGRIGLSIRKIVRTSASFRHHVCGAAEDAAVVALKNKISALTLEQEALQGEAMSCMAEVRRCAEILETMKTTTQTVSSA